MSRTTRKAPSKWNVPAAHGSYDWILRDIRDEVARMTPPPPPTPPADPPRPPRVHIDIEIVHRKPLASPRAGLWGMTILVWLAVIGIVGMLLLSGCTAAHAQPTSWQSHSDGYLTRYQGTDGAGEPWTGTSYQSGFVTYFDANGPHGEQQHCRAWQQSWQSITECDGRAGP
jgi:hypothetical protein